MCAVEPVAEVAATADSSLRCEHALHVFPSFGIGGVPLRMVRIINHLGKQFRHTLIALDNNFEAAAGIGRDLDVMMLAVRGVRRGVMRNLAGSALLLRRLRPDLLLTYNWGAIEWAAASRFSRAQALDRLLRDPEKRRALGSANRQRVVSEFSQERMFSAYSRILACGRAS